MWNSSREFRVTARTSLRKWGVNTATEDDEGHAEYLPAYEAPQLFWWKKTCIQVSRHANSGAGDHSGGSFGHDDGGSLILTYDYSPSALLTC